MLFLARTQHIGLIHKLSLFMILLGVLFSYYLSRVYTNNTWFEAKDLGWLTVVQFTFLTFFMLLAWWSAAKVETLKDVRLLLIIALVARLLLIPIEPYTSNDVDRYLFDGKIALSGLDPYQINHNDPALQELKEEWSPPEEHALYPTLYPPLSLAMFTVVATAGPEKAPLIWKLIVTFAGILTVFVIASLLTALGRLQHLSLIALSPLLILETGVGVHVDAVSALAVSLALYAFHYNRLSFAGFFVGLGVLTKILPLMLILPLFFGLKKTKESFLIGTALVVTIISGYATTLAFGLIPLGSIGTLFEKWRFGSPLFKAFELFFEGKILIFVVGCTFIVGVLTILYKSLNLDKRISVINPLLQWSMAIVLLVSPVVFPWYLMALVPLVALSPRRFFLVWLSLLPLTYEVLGGFVSEGHWTPSTWPLIVIAMGFVVSIYFEFQKKHPANIGTENTAGFVLENNKIPREQS